MDQEKDGRERETNPPVSPSDVLGIPAADIARRLSRLEQLERVVEDRTTELLVATYDVLDDDGRLAFLDGVRELASTADVDVEDVAD